MLTHPKYHSFFLFLLFTLFLHHSVAARTKRCHSDDEKGLLAFKSSIKSDPSGMLNSWQPGTDCCSWAGISCRPESSNRVTSLLLQGWESRVLSGPISPSLSKVQYLDSFILNDLGNLTGPFPSFLFSIQNISTIVITNSKLSGRIPRNIGNLTNLGRLVLSENQFSGRIPSLAKLTRLSELNLSGNRLSGTIPSSFGRLKMLFALDLSRNQLSGSIPDIFSGTSVHLVRLSSNNFSGNIPKSLCNNRDMAVIDLSHNSLTGQIPDFPSWWNMIKVVDLSWNQLSGVVPRSIDWFLEISRLDLSHNNLNGSFPELRPDFAMSYLDLSYNDYHFGDIPKWIENLSINTLKLVRCGIKMKLNEWKPTAFYANIDLSENELTGSPLPFFNRWLNTTYFDSFSFRASRNMLKFDMKHMKISKNLKVLDLSNNLVFGNVPKTVKRLEELNVSQNHLCGQLPPTKFPASAFLDNDCLCGAPLPPCKV